MLEKIEVELVSAAYIFGLIYVKNTIWTQFVVFYFALFFDNLFLLYDRAGT